MKAITVEPLKAGSARLDDVPEPDIHYGSVLVEAIGVGICGTDAEISAGKYGWASPGKVRLVLGHESLGRVLDPGQTSGLKKGDLVVGIVRRPDPVPCPNCAVGEWDMCRNGRYTERGIKQIDGYMSERWRIEPEYATPRWACLAYCSSRPRLSPRRGNTSSQWAGAPFGSRKPSL
jgi:threonine dehydrogenase-like Zn-dependent dehydrogenase